MAEGILSSRCKLGIPASPLAQNCYCPPRLLPGSVWSSSSWVIIYDEQYERYIAVSIAFRLLHGAVGLMGKPPAGIPVGGELHKFCRDKHSTN